MLKSLYRIGISTTAVMLGAVLLLGGCGPKAKPAAKQQFAFWPSPPGEPRVQYLRSYNAASDVRAKQSGFSSLIYGGETVTDVGINKPYGVAYWNGRIYVCDIRGSGMLVLDLVKKESRLMGASGSGLIKKAVDVAVAPDGLKYVVDTTRNSILVFDAEERFVTLFAHKELNPVGLALYGKELFVCDFNAQIVKVLDRFKGNQVRTIGVPIENQDQVEDDGKFLRPLSVAADAKGNIYVADVFNARVHKFANNGTFLMRFGQSGRAAGSFALPKRLQVDNQGNVYVVDAQFNNVQVFDEEGKVMGFFGGPGNHPGSMYLPAGLAIVEDPKGMELFSSYVHPAFKAERLVIVTNNFGANKISVYAMGQLREGKTLLDVTPGRIDIQGGIEDPSEATDGVTTQPATLPATRPAADGAQGQP